MARWTSTFASTISCVLLVAGSARAAETLWIAKEANATGIYPDLAVGLTDRNEGGWRVIEWIGLVGFESEPLRSQAANTFALYLRGVPAELKPGMTFRVDYRYQRTSAGRWSGKPYRHDLMKIAFSGFCECHARNPETGRFEGFRIDIPEDRDEAEGSADFKCEEGFQPECSGYIDAGARPWSAVLANYKWVKTPNARPTGRDTAGNPLESEDGTLVARAPDGGGTMDSDAAPQPTAVPGVPVHRGPPAGGASGGGASDPGAGPSGACSSVFDVGVQIGAAELASTEGEASDVILERLEAAAAASQRVFFFARGGLDALIDALRHGARPGDVRADIVAERRRFARLAAEHCACDITGLR